ncbi:hypothetical protein SAMN04515668_5071 [Hymenobacter arizonensis]|uniref:Uncharacterized protein n=2 Tax=Hymenobacter arizonensis TaxID=1227077 RepID=A0A1I6BT57_HYMAR|nr:hypothetical protein SAMN04515668_5071 [Hymenobacter arizonensis]
MNTQALRKYMTPFLINAALFLVGYLWLKANDQTGLGGAWAAIGTIALTLLGATLLNLALCIVNFVRGNQALGYLYLSLFLGGMLLVKGFFSAIEHVPGKIGG